jgi:hypothetical protein
MLTIGLNGFHPERNSRLPKKLISGLCFDRAAKIYFELPPELSKKAVLFLKPV